MHAAKLILWLGVLYIVGPGGRGFNVVPHYTPAAMF